MQMLVQTTRTLMPTIPPVEDSVLRSRTYNLDLKREIWTVLRPSTLGRRAAAPAIVACLVLAELTLRATHRGVSVTGCRGCKLPTNMCTKTRYSIYT